jgi:hypothetical protein
LGYLSYQAQIESNLTSNGFTTQAATVHSNMDIRLMSLSPRRWYSPAGQERKQGVREGGMGKAGRQEWKVLDGPIRVVQMSSASHSNTLTHDSQLA